MHRLIATLLASWLFVSGVSAETYTADVWADNWFAFHVNGTEVAHDSVPITTERSFNAESFAFQAQRPFTIGLIARDFKENDTGLEYIGSRRQQMGDGGVILQVRDTGGRTIAVSNEDWRCLITHEAPLNKSCARERNPVAGQGPCGFTATAEPHGWSAPGFDVSHWQAASVYSERDVRPKDGYDRIRWDRNARLIWGPDLETNNTLLCRLTVR
ncbi:PEBP family protein [Parasedimentitalea huanghaiensis]|uniref:PEBP family protein n=1 Tax=Parasedimentitalea huanghaiensis TaxID=2682100 RepID=A0A6L6WGB6_9RHOB|nr:PEBP family protein [Zongyanglinia huanghaiensis]MVO15087.1 PEBP family protein [Zongyanglinia huanghaiensis]